jgi:trigger factor
VNENFDWDAEELTFEYEIGLVPDFTLDLEAKTIS